MTRLLLATRNAHKAREIQEILGPELELRDLMAYPEIPEIVESGKSFEENAKLKAIAVSKELPALVIADDSGLEVEALGGAPGIYSARYAGKNATDEQNVKKLLSELTRAGAKTHQRKSTHSTARSKEQLPITPAGRADLATIRFLFRMDSNRLLLSCPRV